MIRYNVNKDVLLIFEFAFLLTQVCFVSDVKFS